MSIRILLVMLMLGLALALGFVVTRMAAMSRPAATAVVVAPPAPPPPPVRYLVAARPLAPGTLQRDADFTVASAVAADLPAGALPDTADSRASLRGALVRHYLDTGAAITREAVLQPRDRGFLAAVLDADSRAVSIGVDPITGVGGLIWPGDRVDVILTIEFDRSGSTLKNVVGETVLTDLRVIAVDQDMAEGTSAANGVAGRLATTVTLQASRDQAERLTVARQMGHLTLAVRSSNDPPTVTFSSTGDWKAASVSASDVSRSMLPVLPPTPALPGHSVLVIQGDQRSVVTFK
jgi:pilus assembly protein CpaB